jgi:carbamoyl-phosphate synthase small subunit
VQYHPEAAPGPHDAAGEFDAFCALMEGAGAERGGGTSRAGAGHAQA